MVTPLETGKPDLARRTFLDRAEQGLDRIARMIASACVCGVLLIAAATICDVLLRWSGNEPVTAMNEIVQLTFAVAIAACIPAGLSQHTNLKIDIVARYFSPATRAWLELLGSCCLGLFYGVIGWRISLFAETLAAQARTSVILALPIAPFMYCVAALLSFGTLVQVVIILNELRRASAHGAAGMLGAAAVLALLGTVSWLWVVHVDSLSAFAQGHAGVSVVIVFVLMWLMTLLLIPIAAIMGIIGVVGSSLFIGLLPSLASASTEVTDFLANTQMATLPLFLMMGSFAAVADISVDVYRLAHVLMGRLRGGLALTTIAACAGFGALTGHSISTTVTIGKFALPEMRARGYSDAFSTGVCAAGGTIGALLPPASGPLILFALLSDASIGQLFVAAIGPGLLAIALYLVTIAIYVRFWPGAAPVRVKDEIIEVWPALARCGPAFILFASVLGGIYFGVFTATEAAAVGAFGGFLSALFRGKLRGKAFWDVIASTTASTAMIYGLIFGAQILSFFVDITALTETATTFLAHLDWQPIAIMVVILVAYLLLGSVMESFAVMVITVPVVTPLISHLGYDVLWWGIINICVVETGLIHPPLGLNVFVLKSIQPDVSMWTVYRGVFPFVVADLVKIVLLVLFPEISLWIVTTMAR